MPSSNKAKAVFDSGKTASYHIKSVVACQQSAKSSSSFKFIVHRDGGKKRYDFEAESPKVASASGPRSVVPYLLLLTLAL